MADRRKIILSLCLIPVAFLIFCLFMDFIIMGDERILPGLSVEKIDLSYHTVDEAEKILTPVFSKAISRQITFEGEDRNWLYSARRLGLKGDARLTAQKAWQVGRQGFYWRRWQERWQSLRYGTKIPLQFQLDPVPGQRILAGLAGEVFRPASDAKLVVERNQLIRMIPAEEGRMLEIEKTGRQLEEALLNPGCSRVSLFISAVRPRYTTSDVREWKITGVVSSYATNFDPAQEERTFNIKIAVGALDGKVIPGGEVFSFNGAVGPRTKEAGYREALVIENNQFTPGIGGGVCQVVSTIYNVFLQAGFSILERHPHSLPVAYVPAGMDATVADSWADLKMKNPYPTPVILHTEYSPGRIRIFLLGPREDAPTLRFSSRVIRLIEPKVERIKDPSLQPGVELTEQEGRQGMEVEVIKETLKNGVVTSSEIISRDRYKPVNAVVHFAPQ